MPAKTMTTATLADALDTDPRTLRKFLRSSASPVESVGKGKRYELPASAAALKQFGKKFAEWTAAQEKARSERDAAADAPSTPAPADDAVIENDADDTDAEPTDADLAAIELDED